MKSLIFVAVFLCLIVVAHAECVTTEDTFMYIDADRYNDWDEACRKSQVQGMNVMMDDVEAGIAIAIPAGTKFDLVKRVNETVSFIRIGGRNLIAHNLAIRCR